MLSGAVAGMTSLDVNSSSDEDGEGDDEQKSAARPKGHSGGSGAADEGEEGSDDEDDDEVAPRKAGATAPQESLGTGAHADGNSFLACSFLACLLALSM